MRDSQSSNFFLGSLSGQKSQYRHRTTYSAYLASVSAQRAVLARTGTFKNERRRISRAFKIGENLDRALLEKSEKMGMTPSSLVNQILIRYLDWSQYVSDGSTFLTIDRQTLTAMIENLSEDRIIEVARSTALVATHNFVKFRYNEINSDTILDYLELMSTYMNLADISTRRGKDNNSFEVLVRHLMGIKWSVFLSEFISGLFSSFLEMETTSEISPLGCSVLARSR